MFSVKRILLTISLLLSFVHVYSVPFKEYNSLTDYLKEHPNGKHDGQDGNWLKTDRQKNTFVWSNANKINIKRTDGFKEYKDISERSDFYKWFQYQTDSIGFETKWGFAAAITTRKLAQLLTEAAELTGNTNPEIKSFVTEGNKIIFDDIWADLKLLKEQSPIKGKKAETWDGHLLLKEQKLIEPYYQRLSPSSLAKLERLLKKENFFSRLLPGYEFEGNLISIRDRWFYGMKMMQYKVLSTSEFFQEN